MTPRPCEETRERLVDYTDGELSEHDSQAVAEHLGSCPTCRRLARDLRRSLHLTRAIWLDNLEGSRVGPTIAPVRLRRTRRLRRAAIAASILIVVGGVLIVRSTWRSMEQAPASAEIEQQVARVATAARLLAATQILATCDGTESIVEQQYRYILHNYGDTPIAASLRAGNHVNLGELEDD